MLKNFFRRPLGLALSAGGTLGSWQAGALHALEKTFGLGFDAVLGFSAGSLAGAGYFLGRTDELPPRWRNLGSHSLRFSPRMFPPSLFSPKTIWDSLDGITDDEAMTTGRCRLVVVSAPMKRSRHVYAVFTPRGEGGWDAPITHHVAASCAIPMVFPPVPVTYRGQNLTLVDGGVSCGEPLSFTELGPCGDVIVLEMVRPEEQGRRPSGPLRALDQRGRENLLKLMNQGVASLKKLADAPRVFRLGPSQILDFMMLNFRQDNISKALDLGVADARAFMESPEKYLA